MPTFQTNDDVTLYYKDWGPNDGPPAVLIHGWPLSADSWDDIAMPLAEAGHRVVAYDRRGFGRSEQPFTGYDYDTLAADLTALLHHLSLQNAALVGFSMGGGEVARYMSRHHQQHPGHVRSAVLISSVVPYMLQADDNPEGVPQSTFDTMTEGMREDRAHFFSGFFKDFYGVGLVSKPVSDEWLQWSRSVAMSASLKATLACADAFATTDFRSDLASFDVPTLIIHGTSDQTVPIDASARPAAAGIADATLKEYDGAPHGLFKTHQDQLITDLKDFLGR